MPFILPFIYGNSNLMQPFSTLTAVAAPIDLANIDTDRIIPARFLRKPRGAPGYATFLFHDVRFNADGSEKPEFVLNQAPYRGAKILVVAENFGCGSSREMAVWVLEAYGIRSVIAPSLGDIFHQNCYKNGLLPVILPADIVAALRRQLHARPGAMITVDLDPQTVTAPDATPHRFDVDPFRKEMLLTGRDETGLTLGFEGRIREFEARHAREMSWVVPPGARSERQGRGPCSGWSTRMSSSGTSGASWVPRSGSRSIRR